jgi:hypothetical protein
MHKTFHLMHNCPINSSSFCVKTFPRGLLGVLTRGVDYDGFSAIGEFRCRLCIIQYPFRGVSLSTCFLFIKKHIYRSTLMVRMNCSYWSKRDEDRGSTGEANHWLVTIKERLNDNDLISRIDTAHDGAE